MAQCFIELCYCQSKFYIAGIGNFNSFCSCDLNLGPMTFIYELGRIPGKYTGWAKVNFPRQGFRKLSSDRQTDRQTRQTITVTCSGECYWHWHGPMLEYLIVGTINLFSVCCMFRSMFRYIALFIRVAFGCQHRELVVMIATTVYWWDDHWLVYANDLLLTLLSGGLHYRSIGLCWMFAAHNMLIVIFISELLHFLR